MTPVHKWILLHFFAAPQQSISHTCPSPVQLLATEVIKEAILVLCCRHLACATLMLASTHISCEVKVSLRISHGYHAWHPSLASQNSSAAYCSSHEPPNTMNKTKCLIYEARSYTGTFSFFGEKRYQRFFVFLFCCLVDMCCFLEVCSEEVDYVLKWTSCPGKAFVCIWTGALPSQTAFRVPSAWTQCPSQCPLPRWALAPIP